ncbi:MAG: 3'-5' exoribonuclease [Ruminococcus sp.]|nr:3'-5' exoribonuclease [Ruminococcus sp.]
MKTAERNKGKSIICFPDDYVSFDLETTGLSPQYDEIIEVGAVKVHKGEITDTFQSLVKPDVSISDFISNLTGITNDMVSSAPKINEVIQKFRLFVGENILVGYNVSFDINFICEALLAASEASLSNSYVDTLRIAKKLYPEMSHHRLEDVVKN